MSTIEAPPTNVDDGWVPADTFGARLALVRQWLGGWNVKKAAELCELDDQSWRNWEAGKSPRDYEIVCAKIARATGCDRTWLMAGGELSRSRCFAQEAQVRGQLSLVVAA